MSASRVSKRRNVVSLFGAIPASAAQPDEDVIVLLTKLLHEAKAGGISGVAVAWIDPAGAAHTQWDGKACSQQLVAGAAILQARVMRAKLEQDDAG